MLTAYTLVSSKTDEIKNYLENSIVLIDPALNPDGRDRHTQWVNSYKASPLVVTLKMLNITSIGQEEELITIGLT